MSMSRSAMSGTAVASAGAGMQMHGAQHAHNMPGAGTSRPRPRTCGWSTAASRYPCEPTPSVHRPLTGRAEFTTDSPPALL
jgi:hypothetical protein